MKGQISLWFPNPEPRQILEKSRHALKIHNFNNRSKDQRAGISSRHGTNFTPSLHFYKQIMKAYNFLRE
jgi:hypothetical protein